MIPRDRLLELLRYDSDTGKFQWITRRAGGRMYGKEAGTVRASGYVLIKINGKEYLAHRLAWMIAHGSDSEFEIDHINMVKTDNRIANLREATRAQNAANRKALSTNTSGHKGVSWVETSKKWKVMASINGVNTYLGTYESKEEAADVYEAAHTKEFGDFARVV
jgi:hypothetical protein